MKSTRKITIPITIMKIAIKCLKKFRIMIQQEDILVGIIMENKFIFSKILFKMFNFHIDNNRFASGLEEADIKSVKTMTALIKLITDQLVFCHYY